jgi:hypothetical protein
MLARRSFLIGLGSAFAAPAIVRAASLMPVKAIADLDVYGRSPAMDALAEIRELDRLITKNIGLAMQDLGTYGTAVVQWSLDDSRALMRVLPPGTLARAPAAAS